MTAAAPAVRPLPATVAAVMTPMAVATAMLMMTAAAGGSSNGSSGAHGGGVGPALVILRDVLPPKPSPRNDPWGIALHDCFDRLDQRTERLLNGPEVVMVPLARTAMVDCKSRTGAAALLAQGLHLPGLSRHRWREGP